MIEQFFTWHVLTVAAGDVPTAAQLGRRDRAKEFMKAQGQYSHQMKAVGSTEGRLSHWHSFALSPAVVSSRDFHHIKFREMSLMETKPFSLITTSNQN